MIGAYLKTVDFNAIIANGVSGMSEEKIAVLCANISKRAEDIFDLCETDDEKVAAYVRGS